MLNSGFNSVKQMRANDSPCQSNACQLPSMAGTHFTAEWTGVIGIKCRTQGFSLTSQTPYHWATALPKRVEWKEKKFISKNRNLPNICGKIFMRGEGCCTQYPWSLRLCMEHNIYQNKYPFKSFVQILWQKPAHNFYLFYLHIPKCSHQ